MRLAIGGGKSDIAARRATAAAWSLSIEAILFRIGSMKQSESPLSNEKTHVATKPSSQIPSMLGYAVIRGIFAGRNQYDCEWTSSKD